METGNRKLILNIKTRECPADLVILMFLHSVTLEFIYISTLGKLKNMPDHGGNGDVQPLNYMLAQCSSN